MRTKKWSLDLTARRSLMSLTKAVSVENRDEILSEVGLRVWMEKKESYWECRQVLRGFCYKREWSTKQWPKEEVGAREILLRWEYIGACLFASRNNLVEREPLMAQKEEGYLQKQALKRSAKNRTQGTCGGDGFREGHRQFSTANKMEEAK